MRHRKHKGKISRRTSWRKATFQNMANDLIAYERIETTLGKAKALRGFVEPLITMAKKDDSVNGRRKAFSKLCDKTMVKKLFDKVAPLFKDVPGGYTRVLASYARKGDGARMAIIELTKRTLSDAVLLGTDDQAKAKKTEKLAKPAKTGKAEKTSKAKAGKKTAAAVKEKAEKGPEPDKKKVKEGPHHAAPDVSQADQEERFVEDIRKEKAKTEQKKVAQKGIFRRFHRKSI